jgi:hypothetical protein
VPWIDGTSLRGSNRCSVVGLLTVDYNSGRSKKPAIPMGLWRGNSGDFLLKQRDRQASPEITCWYYWRDDWTMWYVA